MRGAALTSLLRALDTAVRAEGKNSGSLARINREFIARAEAIDALQRIVLDMDTTDIAVYCQQENSAHYWRDVTGWEILSVLNECAEGETIRCSRSLL